ncbi:MAG: helix-turn-helix domain-containing protein, partial [Metallosphaera sp.]
RNNGIVLNTMKFNGGEIWNLLAYEYKLNKLLNEIKEFAQIERVDVTDEIPINDLSDRELKILSLAYDLGYFDYPRRIKAEELAKIIGIKQSTLIYHLRRAENKIIGYFIKKLINNS